MSIDAETIFDTCRKMIYHEKMAPDRETTTWSYWKLTRFHQECVSILNFLGRIVKPNFDNVGDNILCHLFIDHQTTLTVERVHLPTHRRRSAGKFAASLSRTCFYESVLNWYVFVFSGRLAPFDSSLSGSTKTEIPNLEPIMTVAQRKNCKLYVVLTANDAGTMVGRYSDLFLVDSTFDFCRCTVGLRCVSYAQVWG